MRERLHKLLRILFTPKCWRGLIFGVGASVEHRVVLRTMRAACCKTVVDIGANRGQFALAATAFVPDARVFSFEPLERPARRYRKLFQESERVRLWQVAIGASQETVDAHVSRRDDSSSLLPIGELQKTTFPGTEEVGVERIQVEKLNSVLAEEDIASPALLKLDVQGFELEALKGSLELLSLFDYVYVECSFVEFYSGQPMAGEVIEFLRQHRFEFCGIYNLCHDRSGSVLQGDFLFRRTSSETPQMAGHRLPDLAAV